MGMTVPCVIRSDKPQFNLVRAAVGDQALELSWATLAFQPMRNFDVIVLPTRASCQRNMSEYDASGRLIRSVATRSRPKEVTSPSEQMKERPSSSVDQISNVTSKGKNSTLFVLSVVINIVLAAVCTALLALRRSATDSSAKPTTPIVVTNFVERVVKETVPAQLTDDEKAEIKRGAVEQFLKELKSRFPGDEKISDFEINVKKLPNMNVTYQEIMHGNNPDFKDAKTVLISLKKYVTFLNEEILEK
jgi:hypothetical protein